VEDAIPVGIVHGSRMIRDGIRDLLRPHADVRVVDTFGTLGEALARAVAEDHVLLCDLATVHREGPDVLRDVHRRAPQARLLIFNVTDDEGTIVECIGVGAAGCILQDASLDELVQGIHSVWHGTPVMSPRCIVSLFSYVARLRAGEGVPPSLNLTRREAQILELVAEGLSNKEIAQRLFLQPQTVKNYVHLVLQKLDVHSRLEAMRLLRSARR